MSVHARGGELKLRARICTFCERANLRVLAPLFHQLLQLFLRDELRRVPRRVKVSHVMVPLPMARRVGDEKEMPLLRGPLERQRLAEASADVLGPVAPPRGFLQRHHIPEPLDVLCEPAGDDPRVVVGPRPLLWGGGASPSGGERRGHYTALKRREGGERRGCTVKGVQYTTGGTAPPRVGALHLYFSVGAMQPADTSHRGCSLSLALPTH